MDAMIRPGRDADGPGIIALTEACWSLYPGVRLDVDGESPELRALATYYAKQGGALFVADDSVTVRGMIALRPTVEGGPSGWEICKVYVDPTLHGGGLAHTLLDVAEHHARQSGAQHLVLWSDTRFERAHRFYEKRSYVRAGPIRVLWDISHSLEFRYAKPLSGVRVLDVAAASSAALRMAKILTACVDAGDAVGFLAPLAIEQARRLWDRVALDVGSGTQRMACAWHDGQLVGGGTIRMDMSPTRAHVAEVERLMMLPEARRHGYGRHLLESLQAEAISAGRCLLTLRIPMGGAADALYRSLGFAVSGTIPGAERDAHGRLMDSGIFWKALAL